MTLSQQDAAQFAGSFDALAATWAKPCSTSRTRSGWR